MTIATLMATSLIFLGLGWTDDSYQPIALVVGAVVCIAAANAGATSQDLKTGYLVGGTPFKQQIGLMIGVTTSAIVIGFTVLLLERTLGIWRSDSPASQPATCTPGDVDGDRHQRVAEPEPALGAGYCRDGVGGGSGIVRGDTPWPSLWAPTCCFLPLHRYSSGG